MSPLKGLVLVLAITAIFCQEHEELSPELLAEFENVFNTHHHMEDFLAIPSNGSPVTIEPCMEKPEFKHTKLTVDPNEVIKGKSIRFKVVGVMLSEQIVNSLHIEVFNNGNQLPSIEVDKGNVTVKKGPWWFDYESAVPSFVPQGKWEIFMNLLNKDKVKLSCIKGTFNIDN